MRFASRSVSTRPAGLRVRRARPAGPGGGPYPQRDRLLAALAAAQAVATMKSQPRRSSADRGPEIGELIQKARVGAVTNWNGGGGCGPNVEIPAFFSAEERSLSRGKLRRTIGGPIPMTTQPIKKRSRPGRLGGLIDVIRQLIAAAWCHAVICLEADPGPRAKKCSRKSLLLGVGNHAMLEIICRIKK